MKEIVLDHAINQQGNSTGDSMEWKELNIPGYERVVEVIEPAVGLHVFIAIHNTSLGPALGGTRIYPYTNHKDALDDALRLAKAMTYKSAIAEDGLGGGKAVIIADSKTQKTEKLLLAFGEVVDRLQGSYIAAEDVGTSPTDMTVVRRKTKYVAALPTHLSSGDPSRFTAYGVFRGICAVAQSLWGSPKIQGRTIAIQGLGNVGAKLARLLFWNGANLVVCDVDPAQTGSLAKLYGAKIAPPQQFETTPCDIFAPCALGGVINEKTIPQLQCAAIAGAANNQLAHADLGQILQKKNILYAPDYVVNSGGIINAAQEFEPGGYDPKTARDKVYNIYNILLSIFETSKKNAKPTSLVAEELAKHNLDKKIGKRTGSLHFH